jgi:hypothetical protein
MSETNPMKNTRRRFLQLAAVGGLAANANGGTPLAAAETSAGSNLDHILLAARRQRSAQFNMCGFALPRMERIRIGIIGIGSRGSGAVNRLRRMEGVELKALCDIIPEKVARAVPRAAEFNHQPTAYTEGEDAWRAICDRSDIDLVYICTPWALHVPMAVAAMEHGKIAAVEIPVSTTVEGCWQVVETSERTRKPCLMMANTTYNDFGLLVLNLIREGYFGDIIHAEGAYIHDRMKVLFKNEVWRVMENIRKGNLYPTHGLGPICQALKINRGVRLEHMVSMSSDDFGMLVAARKQAAANPAFASYAGQTYRGNISTSLIRTSAGQTISLQHDCTSPRPYSRAQVFSGTRAFSQQYPLPARIAVEENWLTDEQFKKLEDRYTPQMVKMMAETVKRVGGHGGMDTMMDWRLIDCLRHGLPLDMDVYDAATWSVVGPLSEWSVANGSKPIEVPDFTNGAWKKNQPWNPQIAKGAGTTRVA